MEILLFIVGILIIGIIGITTGFSLYFTRRQGRTTCHDPKEFGLDYEDVRFPAKDGLLLQGCWVPCRDSEKAVIILHGHGGSLDWDVHRAPFLHKAGYNVFLFDFRAHGRSEGKLASFGFLERNDVWGAVEYLRSRNMNRIGLLGFSYGGLVSMLATPDCPDVHAVITDGGPARMHVAIAARGMELHIPKFLATPLAWLIIAITSVRLRASLFRFEPVNWVGKISPRPILFIHGEKDQYCPDYEDLFTSAKDPKFLWFVPGTDHTKASEVFPAEYQRRVLEFFNNIL